MALFLSHLLLNTAECFRVRLRCNKTKNFHNIDIQMHLMCICSFLTEMESAITNHAMIGFDICDIIRHHCEQKFDVYISYIGGHQLQSQTLKELE